MRKLGLRCSAFERHAAMGQLLVMLIVPPIVGIVAYIVVRLISARDENGGSDIVRRRSGGVASPDYFTATILVSLPDESNDDVGDYAHDRGNDQHHQELAHGCVPFKRRAA